MREPTALLLTGRPGTGKTTIIRQVVARLAVPAGGFYTQEVRAAGRRTGFRIITLDGQEAVLADVALRSPYRVGRYGVNLQGIDAVAVPALEAAIAHARLIVVDEIGKMELFSQRFRQVVTQALVSGRVFLGTIMLAPHPWADAVKAMPQVRLLEVTLENRAWLRQEVLTAVRRCLGEGSP